MVIQTFTVTFLIFLTMQISAVFAFRFVTFHVVRLNRFRCHFMESITSIIGNFTSNTSQTLFQQSTTGRKITLKLYYLFLYHTNYEITDAPIELLTMHFIGHVGS